MVTIPCIIRLPNVLGAGCESAEMLLAMLEGITPGTQTVLDLADVAWVRPYGAVLLLSVCRYLTQLSGHPVRLSGFRTDIHAYLRRIDFFECVAPAGYTEDNFDEASELGRSQASDKVLELVPIQTSKDVYQVGTRARRILTSWLDISAHDINQIVTLLAEACSNVVDHSGESGLVVIQKYDHRTFSGPLAKSMRSA